MKSFCHDQTVLQKIFTLFKVWKGNRRNRLKYYFLELLFVISSFGCSLYSVFTLASISCLAFQQYQCHSTLSYKIRLKIRVAFFKLFTTKSVSSTIMVAGMLRITLVSIKFGDEAKIIFSGSVRFKIRLNLLEFFYVS